MTSKKRRYGDLSERPLPTEDPSLIDDVFAAFTGTRPAVEPVHNTDRSVIQTSSSVEPVQPANPPALETRPFSEPAAVPNPPPIRNEPVRTANRFATRTGTQP